MQVIIDGIIQLKSPYHVPKPASFQVVPQTPNFDKQAEETIKYEGLPPLRPKRIVRGTDDGNVDEEGTVIFTNVSEVWGRVAVGRNDINLERILNAQSDGQSGIVVVHNGQIICQGLQSLHSCAHYMPSQIADAQDTTKPHPIIVDLEGGSIAPGLVSSGSALGLHDIATEESTSDGFVFDSLTGVRSPSIVGGDEAAIRALDGLKFNKRDQL